MLLCWSFCLCCAHLPLSCRRDPVTHQSQTAWQSWDGSFLACDVMTGWQKFHTSSHARYAIFDCIIRIFFFNEEIRIFCQFDKIDALPISGGSETTRRRSPACCVWSSILLITQLHDTSTGCGGTFLRCCLSRTTRFQVSWRWVFCYYQVSLFLRSNIAFLYDQMHALTTAVFSIF